jgi:uncharacterized protein YcfJ
MNRLSTQAIALFSTLCASASFAQDVGRVLSSTPVMQQISVPRQVCSTEQVVVQQPKSGAGAAMGAIAGGAIGNSVGRGGGQAAATVLGVLGGAVLGDRIEGAPEPQWQNVQRCNMQTFYENRPVAYNVVYEYAGKQYNVQMPNDPGPTIALSVAPVGAGQPGGAVLPAPAPVSPVVYSAPVVIQQPPVFVAQSVYPTYYARPYYPRPVYPSVQFHFGTGYWGGHGGHHRRH